MALSVSREQRLDPPLACGLLPCNWARSKPRKASRNPARAGEISVLCNIVENGHNIGALDAGMIWHKDMTYQEQAGWATVLYGMRIPRRDGRPLGATRFANAAAAYDDLPWGHKEKLKDAIGIHNSVMYNAKGARRRQRTQADLFSEEKIKKKIPLPHPILLTHPISGRKVLYCDPGHVERIEES